MSATSLDEIDGVTHAYNDAPLSTQSESTTAYVLADYSSSENSENGGVMTNVDQDIGSTLPSSATPMN
jgi:hypothetical protein